MKACCSTHKSAQGPKWVCALLMCVVFIGNIAESLFLSTWKSAMKARGKTPGSARVPSMVCVLPAPDMPYAIITALWRPPASRSLTCAEARSGQALHFSPVGRTVQITGSSQLLSR